MSFPESEYTESVIVSPFGGTGSKGPFYNASAAEVWYIEPGFMRITDAKGAEVVCSAWACAPKDTTVNIGAKMVYDTRTYEAVDVRPFKFSGSVHHVEVYLKSVGIK